MNDYSAGALEALAWCRARLMRCQKLREFKEARKEIEEMILTLASGAAVSFKEKTEDLT